MSSDHWTQLITFNRLGQSKSKELKFLRLHVKLALSHVHAFGEAGPLHPFKISIGLNRPRFQFGAIFNTSENIA